MNRNLLDILIVDDNRFYRKGIKLMLNRQLNVGNIMEASDGNEFLDVIKTRYPDIILMDIKMPEMDGITATKKAIQINHNLKIIALTMFINKEYLMDMILAGAKGFILKNFQENELEIAINAVMNGKNYYAKEALDSLDLNKYLT